MRVPYLRVPFSKCKFTALTHKRCATRRPWTTSPRSLPSTTFFVGGAAKTRDAPPRHHAHRRGLQLVRLRPQLQARQNRGHRAPGGRRLTRHATLMFLSLVVDFHSKSRLSLRPCLSFLYNAPGHDLLLPQLACLSCGCAHPSPALTASLPSPITTSAPPPSTSLSTTSLASRASATCPASYVTHPCKRSLLAAGHRLRVASPRCPL